jgi:hypothetical protein
MADESKNAASALLGQITDSQYEPEIEEGEIEGEELEGDAVLVTESEIELREVGVRLNNLEKLYDTIVHVADAAQETIAEYFKEKTATEKETRRIEDSAHKRVTLVLGYVVTLVFMLSLIALLKNQFELVKLILGSSILLTAGAGLNALIRNKGK